MQKMNQIARDITLKQYHSVSAEERRRTLTVSHRCLYKWSKEAFTPPTCPPPWCQARCELGLSSPPSNEVMRPLPVVSWRLHGGMGLPPHLARRQRLVLQVETLFLPSQRHLIRWENATFNWPPFDGHQEKK